MIARTMVPKVRSVMDGRSKRIAEEIARAEAARAVAEEAQEAWALRLEKSRAEAAAVAQEARRAAARENEAMVNAAVAQINLKVEAAERNIRKAAADIRVQMIGVAADAAQDLVERSDRHQGRERGSARRGHGRARASGRKVGRSGRSSCSEVAARRPGGG